MDDEAAAWGALPPDEHKSVWDETERNFWPNFNRDQESARTDAEQTFRKASLEARVELGDLTNKRSQLTEAQDRLSRELTKVQEELAQVVESCDSKVNLLTKLEKDYRETEQERLEKKKEVLRTMRKWFRNQRGEEAETESEAEAEIEATMLADQLNITSTLNALKQANPSPSGSVNGSEERRKLPDSARAHAEPDASPLANGQHRATAPVSPYATTRLPLNRPPRPEDVLVDIVDADGCVIGPVERIEPWNQWVEVIQELPIKRPVMIRRGRKFGDEHIASIYDRSEAKGVKWLSCMIQATGDIQSQRCVSCDKNQGAFETCTILGGSLFQKCGNCEWNRQGCHRQGADKIATPPELAHRVLPALDPRPTAEHAQRVEEAKHAAWQAQQAATKATWEVEDMRARRQAAQEATVKASGIPYEPRKLPSIRDVLNPSPELSSHHHQSHQPPRPHSQHQSQQPHQPHQAHHQPYQPHHPQQLPYHSHQPRQPLPSHQPSHQQPPLHRPRDIQILNDNPYRYEPEQMPTPKEPKEYPIVSGFNPANAGFTPANTRSRPPSRELPTPTVQSTDPSPHGTPNEPLDEINRANLILRHNGSVYTYPECVAGVPLTKIDETHPYWEPRWPNVKTVIEQSLQLWKQKYEAAVESKAKGESSGSAKFQTGRQVNRGIKILEFLDEGEISPYQLLGKRWTHSGKGAITSYDTLFRLSESLSELEKFNLDITPVEWMRHRLHELMVLHGPNFNVAKTVHDFYHDPKLTALRYKNGFKNIGRPSGLKMGGRLSSSAVTTPSKLDSNKRKSMHSQTGTPRETPSLDQSPLLPYEEAHFGSHLTKRPKNLSPPAAPVHDEFYAGDYSDRDSVTGGRVHSNEFRVYQVKTRVYTSSPNVTQYWSWLENERRFDHQVLTNVNPEEWGRLKSPIDFNVHRDDVLEVAWNVESLMVQLHMSPRNIARKDGQPRGTVMVSFKRHKTIRRFLNLCRDLKLRMAKETYEEMTRRWASMSSEQLPDRDEDASEELRE